VLLRLYLTLPLLLLCVVAAVFIDVLVACVDCEVCVNAKQLLALLLYLYKPGRGWGRLD